MTELVETIIIIFTIFSTVGICSSVGSHKHIKCEECKNKIEIEYSPKDSTYYAICDKCNIYYTVEF